MEPEDVLNKQVCRFLSRGESTILERRSTTVSMQVWPMEGEKVDRDVGPKALWKGEWM